MFHKFIDALRYRVERIVVWSLQRVLQKYSAVIAREIARIDAESNQFRSDVIFVAQDHFESLNQLHSRVEKLEGKA
jgi:nucleoside-triphosphatase THEP1